MSINTKLEDQQTPDNLAEPILGCEWLDEETVIRLRQAEKDDHITFPTRSERRPIKRIIIPGFSATEALLAMRDEE